MNNNKKRQRIRRATRNRIQLKNLKNTRLLVHRTSRHIYAQIITPNNSEVLVSASTVEKDINMQLTSTGNKIAAMLIGKIIAERALEKNIHIVSFDRSGYLYHGRIKAIAESAREAGLEF